MDLHPTQLAVGMQQVKMRAECERNSSNTTRAAAAAAAAAAVTAVML
jgi:hypothetical protein